MWNHFQIIRIQYDKIIIMKNKGRKENCFIEHSKYNMTLENDILEQNNVIINVIIKKNIL